MTNKLHDRIDAALKQHRTQRKAEAAERFGDRLKAALGITASQQWAIEEQDLERHPIGDQHPGIAAVAYVREALSHFDFPAQMRLRYQGMRRQSGSGAHRLSDGVVIVQGSFRSLSGAQHEINVPVMVHAGHMVHPEIFMHNGRTRVMAQSAFDEIVKGAESYREDRERKNMFSPPPPDDGREPGEPQPVMGKGMFGVQAAQDAQFDGLDEAERDLGKACLCPGTKVSLARAVLITGRGGTNYELAAGTKGVVVRDMFGTGDVYYVKLEDGLCVPLNYGDLR